MLKICAPYDQSTIKEIPWSQERDIEQALSKASELFQNTSCWLKAHQRIKILENTVELMKIRKNELIAVASAEGGKPITDSTVEINRAIQGVKLAVQGITSSKGAQIPMELSTSSDNRLAFTFKEPIGVVAAISAFNHPVNLIVHQVITAVAVGCPVIIKPDLNTPLSCLLMLEILTLSGLPEHWCQVVVCENHLAEKLATDKRVNYLSFIGSAKIGWHLRSKLPPGTRCSLEHGGAAPVIVEPDADFTTMIPALVKGGFYHAGQVCVSVQRIFAHHEQARALAEKLGKAASALKVGDPKNPDTEVGPLILASAADRIEQWVSEAVHQGAEVICGAKRISASFYAPTVLLNPPLSAKVSCLEIFGPVVCVYSTANTEEAIEIANSVSCPFQASIFTKNIDQALGTAKKINASAVMINDHTAFRSDWMPFGGRDHAGMGVGGIEYTMQELTKEKLLVMKS